MIECQTCKNVGEKVVGLNSIKEALMEIEKQGVDVLYMGAPKYRLMATDSSYLKAEEKIKSAQSIFEKHKNLGKKQKVRIECQTCKNVGEKVVGMRTKKKIEISR